MTKPTGAASEEPRVQLRDSVDLAVELVRRVQTGNPAAVDLLLRGLSAARLQNLAVALAHLVDEDATLPELRHRAGDGNTLAAALAANHCAPELWGASVNSRAAHGTASRYSAGCRGAACRAAESERSATYKRKRAAEARGQTTA